MNYPIIIDRQLTSGTTEHKYERVNMIYHCDGTITCELLDYEEFEIGDILEGTTEVHTNYKNILREELFPDSVTKIWLGYYRDINYDSLKPGMLPRNLKKLVIGRGWNGAIEKGAIPYGTEKVKVLAYRGERYGNYYYYNYFEQPKENCWVPPTVKTFEIEGDKVYERGTQEFDDRISTYYKTPKNAYSN